MKIDAVELTLFAWDDIPPTKYTSGSQNQSGKSNLALLRIKTDAGIEGNAFLGSATNPAETDAGALIRFLKPILMGKDPLAREDLHAAMRVAKKNIPLKDKPAAPAPAATPSLCQRGRAWWWLPAAVLGAGLIAGAAVAVYFVLRAA